MAIGSDELAPYMRRQGNTGWSANGILVTPLPTPLAPPADQVRSTESIVLQAELREPGYYTLQFFLSARRNPLAPGITYRGKAEIIWTVKGNSVRRVISVYSGTSISGAGGFVQVTLRDDSFSVFGGIQRDEYPASILLAQGSRPGTPNPPILLDRDFLVAGARPPYVIAPGATINIQIPEDSGVNQMMLGVTQTAAPSTALVSPNDIVARYTGGFLGGLMNMDYFNRWVPVEPGQEFVQVINRSGVDYTINPIWGVEG